jgi:hypothetical protein
MNFFEISLSPVNLILLFNLKVSLFPVPSLEVFAHILFFLLLFLIYVRLSLSFLYLYSLNFFDNVTITQTIILDF